jgi:hypothetical protein
LFPNSSDHNRQRSYGKQQQQNIPYNEPVNMKANNLIPTNIPNANGYRNNNVSPGNERVDPSFNPFVKNEEI